MSPVALMLGSIPMDAARNHLDVQRPHGLAADPMGGAAGTRLGLLEQSATILLTSLPMIFLHWRAMVGELPEQLEDAEIRVLFFVYAMGLIATALVRGLAAVGIGRPWPSACR